jgi:hypothetical protein
VRAAALIPIREEIQLQRRAAKAAKAGAGAAAAAPAAAAANSTRPLVAADLIAALESVKPTGVAAAQYRFAQAAATTGVSFAADVPAYVPSQSLRLNTKSLTSQIEQGGAGAGAVAKPAALGGDAAAGAAARSASAPAAAPAAGIGAKRAALAPEAPPRAASSSLAGEGI